jgi:hypothetical protein
MADGDGDGDDDGDGDGETVRRAPFGCKHIQLRQSPRLVVSDKPGTQRGVQ